MSGPIYLVRHAKAGHRTRWEGNDELRPLSKPGRRQAEALVELFAEQPFTRLLSSRYVRCVQTFEPLSAARAMPIEHADALAEGAGAVATLDLLRAAAADAPVALSTHGDIILNVLDHLAAANVPLSGPVAFAKGSTWVLELSDGSFTAGRYIDPP